MVLTCVGLALGIGPNWSSAFRSFPGLIGLQASAALGALVCCGMSRVWLVCRQANFLAFLVALTHRL